jgi:hypothetical protein
MGAPSIVNFPAAKFTDNDSYDIGLSGSAQVWISETKGLLDGKRRSHDIAGGALFNRGARAQRPRIPETSAARLRR